tara:strand:+ start:4403 stop:5323 length:921 start_codon:yes stop_codon:yes gene_type:complete
MNLSDARINGNLDKKGLKKLIVLPDYCPGRDKLPTGSVAVYSKDEHTPSSKFIGPDIGCGMTLAQFDRDVIDVEHITYLVANELKAVDTELGSLGGGNHFINFYQVVSADALDLKQDDVLALIHSGSRLKGKKIFEEGLVGDEYIREHNGAVEFGEKNRSRLIDLVQNCSNAKLNLLLDLPHNTLEVTDSDFIYRKGAMKLKSKEYGVIPSTMGGEAVLIRGTDSIEELENSICHGTGRKISRSDSKNMEFDSTSLRKKIYIPNSISDSSLRTEAPHCYRGLDEVLPKLHKYASIVGRLKPLSYVG